MEWNAQSSSSISELRLAGLNLKPDLYFIYLSHWNAEYHHPSKTFI